MVSVAWSADQRYALSGSEDSTAWLWEVETGRYLRVLEGNEDRAVRPNVAWRADQRRVLFGDGDGVVVVGSGGCGNLDLSPHRVSSALRHFDCSFCAKLVQYALYGSVADLRTDTGQFCLRENGWHDLNG